MYNSWGTVTGRVQLRGRRSCFRAVGDPDVLAEVAEGVNLGSETAEVDQDEIRAATEDDDLEAALRERFEQAQQAGVSGIPTFVYEDHAARDAIPPAQFERLILGAN
ncbi:DsbA family oxidoreductase [Halorussus litoreus]|uniref:DsbA family oxidoreductase n=1 Tax=Halorussus litoreus TaxID=1710536 RepID=UPI0022B84A07|nr:DsbA family protein [Halorussus litoreus]